MKTVISDRQKPLISNSLDTNNIALYLAVI